MKLSFIRQEDYWIYPLSVIGVVFTGFMLYAGAFRLRLVTGLVGFSIFFFLTYIIRKNYSKQRAAGYLLAYLIASIIFALVAYFLTN